MLRDKLSVYDGASRLPDGDFNRWVALAVKTIQAQAKAVAKGRVTVRSTLEAFGVLGPVVLADPSRETVAMVVLDTNLEVMSLVKLGDGSDRFSLIDPRQVARVAVVGSGVVLAHNHPSGKLAASAQDCEVTLAVGAALRVLGVHLLDHLIITPSGYLSMRENGDAPAAFPK